MGKRVDWDEFDFSYSRLPKQTWQTGLDYCLHLELLVRYIKYKPWYYLFISLKIESITLKKKIIIIIIKEIWGQLLNHKASSMKLGAYFLGR